MNNNILLNTIFHEIEELKQKERKYQSEIDKIDKELNTRRFTKGWVKEIVTPLSDERNSLERFVIQLAVNRRDLQTAHKVVFKYGYEGGKK